MRQRFPALVAVLLGALLFSGMAAAHTPSPAGHAIKVKAKSIPLDPLHPSETRAGDLTFVGGLVLKSKDKQFGGFSGLDISPDGKWLTAISDRGRWLTARVIYQGEAPVGLTDAWLAPMQFAKKNQKGKGWADAEGLARSRSGEMVVSFERRHRVLSYNLLRGGLAAVPRQIKLPKAVKTIRDNKGLEGLVTLDDGRLLAFTERTFDLNGRIMGWVETDRGFKVLYAEPIGIFHITGMARLSGGDIVMLERRFTLIGGPGMQMRRISRADIQPGAVLDGPVLVELSARFNIDNMEGLAIRPNPAGGDYLYVISDDNFSDVQRTLLLVFKLP